MIHGIVNLLAFAFLAVGLSVVQWKIFDYHWGIKIVVCLFFILLSGFFVQLFLVKWTDFLFTDKERGFERK